MADVDNIVKDCKCKATALVVDDATFNQIALEIILLSMSMHCVKASNGQDAVNKFKKDQEKKCCNVRLRYIFMDIVMPIMDGYVATQKIIQIAKMHGRQKEIIVMGVTAYVD